MNKNDIDSLFKTELTFDEKILTKKVMIMFAHKDEDLANLYIKQASTLIEEYITVNEIENNYDENIN